MLTIRPYENDDYERVMLLHRLPLELVGAWLGRGPWDEDLDDIQGHYPGNGGLFLVGVLDGQIEAMGAFRRLSDEQAEIKRMRVHPDWQGRGFGQKIYMALETEARRMGYTGLVLETGAHQLVAQNLYRKFGFVETHRGTVGNDGMECIWFAKDLTADVAGDAGSLDKQGH